MAPSEIIQAATRVLVAYTTGREPDLTDVEILRQTSSPGSDVDPDILACRLMRDLGYTVAVSASAGALGVRR